MKIETIQLSDSCQIELHHVKGTPSDPPESDAEVLRYCFDLSLTFDWVAIEGILLTDRYITLMSQRLGMALNGYRLWIKQVAKARGLTVSALALAIGEQAIQETLIASVLSEGLQVGLKRGSEKAIRQGRPTFTPIDPKSPRTRSG